MIKRPPIHRDGTRADTRRDTQSESVTAGSLRETPQLRTALCGTFSESWGLGTENAGRYCGEGRGHGGLWQPEERTGTGRGAAGRSAKRTVMVEHLGKPEETDVAGAVDQIRIWKYSERHIVVSVRILSIAPNRKPNRTRVQFLMRADWLVFGKILQVHRLQSSPNSEFKGHTRPSHSCLSTLLLKETS